MTTINTSFICFSTNEGGERGNEPVFSGLYAYHVPTNTWKKVMDDCAELRSRIGHSMLFHTVRYTFYY